jgi:hypothetical protein
VQDQPSSFVQVLLHPSPETVLPDSESIFFIVPMSDGEGEEERGGDGLGADREFASLFILMLGRAWVSKWKTNTGKDWRGSRGYLLNSKPRL